MFKKCLFAVSALTLVTAGTGFINAQQFSQRASKPSAKQKVTLASGDKVYDATNNTECGVVYSMQQDSTSGNYVFTVIGQPAAQYQNNLFNPCNAKEGDKFVLSDKEELGTIGTAYKVGPYWMGQPTVYITINPNTVNPSYIPMNPQMLQK